MTRLRWPKSIHAQVESVFRHISSIGQSKSVAPQGHIRSFGTLRVYKAEAHSFARFLKTNGITDLRQTAKVESLAIQYLAGKLSDARTRNHSYQTQKLRSSALSALQRGFNEFFKSRGLSLEMNMKESQKEYLALSKAYLKSKAEYPTNSRAYPQPDSLVAAISNQTYALQATIQYQSGLRAEGVGAPSGRLKNPLTQENLQGIVADPVTHKKVGAVKVKEKGGKWTTHYLPEKTYAQLSTYIAKHGKLESSYQDYRNAIVMAAKLTGQHAHGRGTHGLKTSFAQFRYKVCVQHGLTHERALQATALELAHNRFDVTLLYLKG